MSIYRYKLKDFSLPPKRKIINGVLLFSYKWSYTKNNYDFPPEVLKEKAKSVKEFQNLDKQTGKDIEERERAIHVKETPVLEEREILPDPVEEESIEEEPMLEIEEDEEMNYKCMTKKKLTEYLLSKGFSKKELKGRKKDSLIKLVELEDTIDEN